MGAETLALVSLGDLQEVVERCLASRHLLLGGIVPRVEVDAVVEIAVQSAAVGLHLHVIQLLCLAHHLIVAAPPIAWYVGVADIALPKLLGGIGESVAH